MAANNQHFSHHHRPLLPTRSTTNSMTWFHYL